MNRCAICHTLIQLSESTQACQACKLEYHLECWDQNAGCATYGCVAAPVAQKPSHSVFQSKGWGDEKECPKCHKVIASSLLGCSCGARFPWIDPMSSEEYEIWLNEEQEKATIRSNLIVLFSLTLFAAPAPITGPVAGLYAFSQRRFLAGEYGTFQALGYGTAAIGITYGIIFMLLLAGM